jgi:hypothetical protein
MIPMKLFILSLLLLLLCSCASERYVQGRSKPEIIETGYNLIRAKLNKLGLLDKYIVEMDTLSCRHRKSKNYGGSWLGELLGIGTEREIIEFWYFLSVVEKPYLRSKEHFYLDNPQQIFFTKTEINYSVSKAICVETTPDTSLQSIPISFSAMLHKGTAKTAEEMIEIARRTFQLDTQFRCVGASPYRTFNSTSDNVAAWSVAIELMPSDTIVYNNLKHYDISRSCEEIIQYLKLRQKTDGECFCPQYILVANIDAEDKRAFQVRVNYRVSYDELFDAPDHLRLFDEELERRIRKWREENADYIKSKQ